MEGDFFRAADLEALPALQRGNKFGGFQQAVRGSSVKPGITTAHLFDVLIAALKIGTTGHSRLCKSIIAKMDAEGNMNAREANRLGDDRCRL